MSEADSMSFKLCDGGLVRFPRNVEEIRVDVERGGAVIRLMVRRNEDRRTLHLTTADARAIAGQLLAAAERCEDGGIA